MNFQRKDAHFQTYEKNQNDLTNPIKWLGLLKYLSSIYVETCGESEKIYPGILKLEDAIGDLYKFLALDTATAYPPCGLPANAPSGRRLPFKWMLEDIGVPLLQFAEACAELESDCIEHLPEDSQRTLSTILTELRQSIMQVCDDMVCKAICGIGKDLILPERLAEEKKKKEAKNKEESKE